MKTYDQFREEYLQEMEYQAPPKPVPKAPIERKAQQPETRKSPAGIASSIARKVASNVKSNNASMKNSKLDSEVKPTGADHGDHPQDPKQQNKDTGKNVRRALGGVADAIKKKRAGSAAKSKQTRPDAGKNIPSNSRPAPAIRSVFNTPNVQRITG